MGLLGVVVVMVVVAMVQWSSHAAVYKVGDSAGWTTIGNVDYKQWSALKTFKLGDLIIFQYNPQFHNVVRVTHSMYKACNASTPLATYTTGNDTILITNHGHHFFFCGVPGHCQSGQKVDINVLQNLNRLPAIAPSPSLLPPPAAAATEVPAPSNAATYSVHYGHFARVVGFAVLMSLFVVA